MMAKTDSSGRKMWLFDSFQGIPDPTAEDFDEAKAVTGEHIRPLVRGSCLGTKSTVELVLFSRFGLSRDSVYLVEGWFQDTLPVHRDRIGQIALLRLDGDWYESTLCCLNNCYDRVSPGGYIIVDDYGSCYGCKKAVHEFLESKDVEVRLIPDGRGGVLFSKPA
jgi:O-methyltransferase